MNAYNLRIPGPVTVHPEVAEAGARAAFNHRGPQFSLLLDNDTDGMRSVLRTGNDVIFLASSGTGGLEAAATNILSPGDTVIVDCGGSFGERHAQICRRFGARTIRLEHPWGTALEADQLREALLANPRTKVVFLTHNETSTGVVNDIQTLASLVHEVSGALVVVDTVSGVGAMPFDVDAWGVDIAVCASQKAFACMPGLAMLGVSDKGWAAMKTASVARFYFDLQAARAANEDHTALFTPALGVMMQLEKSLEIMDGVGLDASFERQQEWAKYVRDLGQELGLKLFSDPAHSSNAVVAFEAPEGLGAKTIQRHMLETYNTEIAHGQGQYTDKLIRIGLLGYWTSDDIVRTMRELQQTLQALHS